MKTLRLTALAFLAVTICSFTTFEKNGELQWMNWNDGYAAAKKKNKILVADVYTDWCGWCKVMDRETFSKTEVIDLINNEFIPVKFNPEIKDIKYKFNGQEYSGEQLAGVISEYKLSGYPTTIFYFPKTNELKMEVGYKNPQQFLEILNNMVKYKNEGLKKK